MKKVTIVGSGNVGVNSAFFIAENAAANIMLIDIKDGISQGKALDLMEAAPIRRYRTKIEGSNEFSDMINSDVVVLAAGLIRGPGKDRYEHFEKNAEIARDICGHIKKYAPDAKIIVATEPVDAMVKVVTEATSFPRNRILGIGGILDSTRMKYFIAEALNVSSREVTALVLGSHTSRMVPLPFYSRVNGIEITQLLSSDKIADICQQTKDAGSIIIELSKRSNAYYAPSAAIAQVVEAICIDTKHVCPISILLDGEYGIKDIAVSVPCKVGASGVEKIIELNLDPGTLKSLQESAEHISGLH